jgi:hypothetical protein
MATVTTTYGTLVTVTMTGIEDIDASSGMIAGWTSNSVNNTSDKHVDFLLSGQFTCESTNQQAGTIAVYVYGSFSATPTWPDLFSAGTEGSVGAATCHDSEERDSGMRLAAAIIGDGSASAVYTFAPVSIASLFGGVVPPYWAIWVTGNTATSTNDLFVSSGTALYIVPIKYDVA